MYSYKIASQSAKNPHQIPLPLRERFKKGGYEGMKRENEYRSWSQKPFGRHTSKGRFLFDKDKVPFYNIPDLEGFNLKPYVSYATPKVQDDLKVTPQL